MAHLYLIAGPNGAGKTTLYERVIGPTVGLPFLNADRIAAEMADGAVLDEATSIAAVQEAAVRRDRLIEAGRSFVAETVFSHRSEVELVRRAAGADYSVHLYVVVVPVELSVARVVARVANGGHSVPEERIRARHARLFAHVAEAMALAAETVVYDNSSLRAPFRKLYEWRGETLRVIGSWPDWGPAELHPDRLPRRDS